VKREVVCKIEDVERSLNKLSFEACALDTETTHLWFDRLKLTGVSLCDGEYNIYIPIGLEGDDSKKLSLLKTYLSSLERLIAHNWVFDAKVLYKYGIDLSLQKRFDTMIAHHLLDENERHGLKHLTKTLLNKDVAEYDDKLSHYHHKFYEYALDDSLNTWLLYKHFLPLLHKEGVAKLFFNIEMPFQSVLLEMEIEGVLIDQPLLKEQQKTLVSEILRLETQLYDLLDEPYSMQLSLTDLSSTVIGNINFNSSKQLGEILFGKLGLEVIEHTDGGQPKTGTNTIQKYKEQVPFVAALEKYKIAKKLHDAFVSPEGQIQSNLQNDGRVRPNFKDVGTKTGRLSCSNPNLQQLPKPKDYAPVNVRELFCAPKGYKMFSCDYSGQEVAVAAQQSKDPTLVEALKGGMDMHLTIANQFYNLKIPKECLKSTHPEYEEYKAKFKKERTEAKVITFGLMYGKAQPLHSKILTPYGWTTFGDIKEGDEVFTQDGTITTVTKVHPVIQQETFRLTFRDGSVTECGYNHLWKIRTRYDISHGKSRVVEANKLSKILKKGKQNNVFIDYCEPLKFTKKVHYIPPYIIGLYLGDGDSLNRFTIANHEIRDKLIRLLPNDCKLHNNGIHYSVVSYNQKRNNKGQYMESNPFIKEMKVLGFEGKTSKNKSIPIQYLYGNVEQRQQLLKGLIDSDGAYNNSGYEYVTISKELADDVEFLVKSLGGRCSRTSRVPKTNFKTAQLSYRLFISFPPTRQRNSLQKIEKIGTQNVRCITVADSSGLYITDDFIVTHNSSYGFSKDFGITEEEAQKIVDDYFAGMPKLKEAIDNAHKLLDEKGFIVNLAGRKRHFFKNDQGYYPGFAYRQSFNFLIQGFSADMIRAAMVTVWISKRKYPEWGLKTVMTVHDEAVYVCKEEYKERATKFVKKCFENVCKKFIVPVNADVEIGENYGNAK